MPRPNGIEFVQTIRVKQIKAIEPSYTATYAIPYTYTIRPNLATIAAIALAEPGSLWLIGNEIDRRDWECNHGQTCGQDEIMPEVYAEAYHQIHAALKRADPTAQVAIGGLVEVTPLRLEYLNRVWDSYQNRYGLRMPVDVWNMHPYMLQEVLNDWGADIPAGLTATVGITYALRDNDNLDYFKQQIVTFRQWMASKGEQHKPLIISEYGVLMPTWLVDEDGNAFTLKRVRDFMVGSFDYLLTAKSLSLGYAPDDYRLVQRWNWYSLDHDPQYYNGALFSYTTKAVDQLGLDWTSYVNDPLKPLGPALNLKMLAADYRLETPNASGLVTATVRMQVSNSGYRNLTDTITVRLSQANGARLGQTTISGLPGCGQIAIVNLQVRELPPGVFSLRAEIDPDRLTPDEDYSDNALSFTLLIPTFNLYFPLGNSSGSISTLTQSHKGTMRRKETQSTPNQKEKFLRSLRF